MDNERQSLLEAILDTAVDAIIVINQAGIVQNVNPATERLFGYSADEVIGSNVNMLMPSPYREEHDGYLRNYHRTQEPKIIGIGREVVGRRKDGSEFPMHLAVSEIQIGNQKHFTGIVRDISDLKKAQQQLTAMNEELEQRVRDRTRELRETQSELLKQEKLATLGQVSGGIAHEIRNPLNAMKTSAYYLMNAKNLTEKKRHEHLERIYRQVTAIDNVVTALSDVARLPDPNTTACDIRMIVTDVARSVATDSTIEVHNEIGANLPHVLVDANQIPIVFRNLIRNARDAMPHGGRITLSANSTPDEILIHVTDTGTGIAEEDIKRITEPLYSTKARGMGLGLAISKAIIDKNRGKLEVVSEVSKGTTFTVTLRKAGCQIGESDGSG